MYSQLNSTDLKKAGDYVLSQIAVVSKESFDGSSTPKKIDITSLVVEINIYEDIDEKNLSGQIVLSDSTGLPNNMPLTGHELIQFKLGTPGSERFYDFQKNPMVIYKIGQRQVHNPRSQFYVLYFCSVEQLTNQTVKVQRSFEGSVDNMLGKVCQGELGTGKDIFIEKTRGNRKYVIPRWKPYRTIDFLCNNAQSVQFQSTGYKFYETSQGFHCRSLESMMAVGVDAARPANGAFKQQITGVDSLNIQKQMQTINSYEILENFNTMKLLATGALASRVLKTDLFNKTFKSTDFDYVKNYEKAHHLEHTNGSREHMKKVVPEYPFRDGKMLSEFPDGTFYHSSDNSNTYEDANGNVYQHIDDGDKISKRISQAACLDSFKMRINVPGYTGLSVGEIITIELPRYEKTSEGDKDRDTILSGRYLVSKIVHLIKPGNSYHSMSVECVKDSVMVPYYSSTIETEPKQVDKKGDVYYQESIDDGIFSTIS
mgnify:CR=1 FL=1